MTVSPSEAWNIGFPEYMIVTNTRQNLRESSTSRQKK
jgi:hypothetical protein